MKRYLLSLLLTFSLGSCVFSLYPASDLESDYVFRKELLGNWLETDNDFVCAIDTIANKKYLITLIDDLERYPGANKNERRLDTSYFEAFLIHLSGQYYIDCSPGTKHESLDRIGENAKSCLLPLHKVYKINLLENDRLIISDINIDSLKKLSSAKDSKINRELMNEDHILLTDRPRELQKNVLSNKRARFIFSDTLVLKKKN
jgi:hypothetical protein